MPTWICRSCGTFNETGTLRCAICGAPSLDQPATQAVGAVADPPPSPPPPEVAATSAVPAVGPPPEGSTAATPPAWTPPPTGPPPGSPPPTGPPPADPNRRWWIVAGIAALVLGALVTALVVRAADDDATASPPSTTQATTTSSTSTTSTTTTSTTTTTTEPPTTTTTAPPTPDVDDVDLRAGTYRVLCPDGEADLSPSQDGGPVVADLFEPTFVGDISGDGRDDAVIHVSCSRNDGGNAFGTSVIAVSSEADGPKQLGGPIEGFDPVAVDERIVVSRATYADTDPSCCPSIITFLPFHPEGGVLAAGGGEAPSSSDPVTPAGLGPLEVGRTFAEVAAASGLAVVATDDLGTDGSCVSVSFPDGPSDLSALGGDGVLHALTFASESYGTAEGLGIGSSEDDIADAYAPRDLETTDAPFGDGHLVTATDRDDDRLLVFATDGTFVSSLTAGDPGWADATEGCA